MRETSSSSILAAAFAAALLCACGKSENQFITAARSHLEKGDTAAATIELKNAIAENANSAQARLLLGKALLATEDPVSAEVELRKARDLGAPEHEVIPELARAMLQLGQAAKITAQFGTQMLSDPLAQADLRTTLAAAQAQQGNVAKAEAELDAALQSQPGYPPAIMAQARLKTSAGDIDGALRLLESVLAKDPGQEHAGVAKASLLWIAKNDPEAALQASHRVLQAKPANVPAQAIIVSILFRQGRHAEARKQFEELKKIAPTHPQTAFFEAQFAYVDKDYQRSRQLTDVLLKAIPDHYQALELAAAAEYKLGNDQQAQAFAQRAVNVVPGLVFARQIAAESLLRTGQPAKALEILGPVAEGEKADAESVALAGTAYLQLGDAKKADAAFKRAAKLAPQNVRVRTEAALAALDRGQVDVSLRELAEVAATDKGVRADLALVSARISQGDLKSALKDIDALQAKMPGKPLPDQLRGQVFVSLRDVAGARRSFEAALKKDAKYFPAVAGLASIDVATGKPEQASTRVKDFLKTNPNNSQALLMLADIPSASGDSADEALKHLAAAARANPRDPHMHLALIARHIKLEDRRGALLAAQAAVAALPDDRLILDALGQAQLLAGEYEQANTTFRRLVALDPGNAIYQMNLAEAAVAGNDLDSAARALKRAAELDPTLSAAPRGLAMLALKRNQPQEALAIAREMQKQRPKDGAGFMVDGDIQAHGKQWVAAAAAYRAALERSAVSEVAIRLHTALRASNQAAEADRVAAQWEKTRPKDPAFHFYLGDVATQKDQYAAAEAEYRIVLAAQPSNAVVMNNVAWLMYKQSKPGALEMAQRANAMLPNRAPLLGTVAEIQAGSGQLDAAIKTQRQAVTSAPKDPRLKLSLARYLIKAGQRAEARDQLLALSRLGDSFPAQAEVAELLKTL